MTTPVDLSGECRTCFGNLPPGSKRKYCRGCRPSEAEAQGYERTRRRARGLRGDPRRQHGLSDERWLALTDNAKCKACGATEPGTANGWHVDHDHRCCPGKFGCPSCVRGILCHGCNVALGMLRDDPNRCRALAAYLENSKPLEPK